MTVRFTIEFNDQRQVLSLDEFTRSFLEAIQRVVRQEVERVLVSRTIPSPQHPKDSEANRPVALSKAKAAQALGVSVRTIDNCISQQKIRVLRIGRRVLVPMNSIEAVLRRGALETNRDNGRAGPPRESSGIQDI
jgi:excisionase family DNA binding protein